MRTVAPHLHVGPDEVAGNGGRGRVFLLPGSPGRAERIADALSDRITYPNPRRHEVHTGTLERDGFRVDLGVVATGMGCPSVGIVVGELIALGVRRLVRVGTSGTLHPDRVPAGSLVVATAAVRDEATSDAFAPREVPATAHPDWVRALGRAARALGHGGSTHAGVVHTKDAFYGREFPAGPLAEESRRYMATLQAVGVLASEMECSHLFVLAAVHGADHSPVATSTRSASVIKAGAVLACVGDHLTGFAAPEVVAAAEERAIRTALGGAVELIRREDHG